MHRGNCSMSISSLKFHYKVVFGRSFQAWALPNSMLSSEPSSLVKAVTLIEVTKNCCFSNCNCLLCKNKTDIYIYYIMSLVLFSIYVVHGGATCSNTSSWNNPWTTFVSFQVREVSEANPKNKVLGSLPPRRFFPSPSPAVLAVLLPGLLALLRLSEDVPSATEFSASLSLSLSLSLSFSLLAPWCSCHCCRSSVA